MMNEDRGKNGILVLAPAKVNLFLRVVGRRSDGYHLIDSLMVPVGLYDEVTIEGASGQSEIALTCNDPTIPCDETNLAYKAAALLCKETGKSARIVLSLRKRIPAGAGLGGGSSDAAAVLKGLNNLLSLGLTEQELCEVAVRLGADVPFFIPCHPARATGIGEILTAVPALPMRWLVIVVPPFRISTPWAYQRFDGISPHVMPPPLMDQFMTGQWRAPEVLVNDLEQVVLPEYPLIGQLKDRLLQLGAEGTLMSGSGSAVFGVFESSAAAKPAREALKGQGKTFLVETLAGPPVDFPLERC